MNNQDWEELTALIADWGYALGFADIGISDLNLESAGEYLNQWLSAGYAGEMSYMSKHGDMRWQPDQLHPDTSSIISVRLDYLETGTRPSEILASDRLGYVSRYALGRDYHKVLRGKLKRLVNQIESHLETKAFSGFSARVFTDSAPILEKAIAEKAGLGWIGKNTLLLNETAGSWFFLGEILTNLPLPANIDTATNRCGSCSACIDICPTDAIVAPYQLDARKCISYLTIELRGSIPEVYREAIGNRVFGCDDCQLVCPWNRYAQPNAETDFKPRHGLENNELIKLFQWSEKEFLEKTEGSAIRRTGYQGWLRNLAIGLGNSSGDNSVVQALEAGKGHSDLVDEHIDWAIQQQSAAKN